MDMDMDMDMDKIYMHDLLREMGREVVCSESPKIPGNRSRLWKQDDVIRILEKNTGTAAVEGISLDICNLEDIDLSSKVFDEMDNLRIILFNTTYLPNIVHFPSGLNCLPDDLMILYWSRCPLRELPPNFKPKKLVELNLCGSDIEQLWKGTKRAPNLKRLNLSFCRRLTKIPNLSDFPLLVKVDLSVCESLVDLTSSGQQLNNLRYLTLEGCINVTKFPLISENIETLNLSELPKGLQCLEAMDCDQLCQVPDASEFVRCINSTDHLSSYHHPVQFIFANSLNLKAAVSNIFEESLRLMQRIKKESGKPSNQFCIYLPGNKIPEWFSGQSLESSVKIRVHRNDLVNRKFMGFAICAVLRVAEYNSPCERFRDPLHRFNCNLKIIPDHIKIGNDRTYLPSNSIIGPNIFIDTEHLLLGYCPFDSLSQNPTMLPGNDYLNILIEIGDNYCGCNGPKHCAVHPIYAEEPLEIIGATIQEIGETSGRRSDRSDENDEEVEPHPKRICTQAINTP
ncbi:hypothetical protein LWI29_002438 [Acer saccharum]|uniref:C-JID domain-containing protein n=1 Tax=Acer saccharum TaxID=4024 RepID=A0AA39W0P0_ACESA|nr:hypothetical protein LWI29_002438 [Acer saccharum]